MILEMPNGVQPLSSVGWAWGWTVYNDTVEPPVIPSRLIRLVAGGGLLHGLNVGGAGVVKLTAGGSVPRRITIGTADG